jgi:hypothetical protein
LVDAADVSWRSANYEIHEPFSSIRVKLHLVAPCLSCVSPDFEAAMTKPPPISEAHIIAIGRLVVAVSKIDIY